MPRRKTALLTVQIVDPAVRAGIDGSVSVSPLRHLRVFVAGTWRHTCGAGGGPEFEEGR